MSKVYVIMLVCVGVCASIALSSCMGAGVDASILVPAEELQFTVDEDASIQETAPGILAPYQLVVGADYDLQVVSDVFNGTLDLSADGAMRYTPRENFYGTDSFIFRLIENGEVVHDGTIVLEVANVPDAPIALGEKYELREDSQLNVEPPGLLTNDYDPDGDALTLKLESRVEHGSLVVHDDGAFTYTPQRDYFGSDRFTYRILGAADDAPSELVTTTLTVHAVNDRPQLQIQTIAVTEAGTVTVSPKHISATDVDNKDQKLVFRPKDMMHCWFTLKSAPKKRLKGFSQSHLQKGNVILHHDGSNRAPHFRVELSDGRAKVTKQMPIKFTVVNDQPVWRKAKVLMSEGEQLIVSDKQIRITDEETDVKKMQMRVLSKKHLSVLNAKTKEDMTEWSQEAIANGELLIIHDGSEQKPQLQLEVSDGTHTVKRNVVFVFTHVNDAPLWKQHMMEIDQGKTLVLTPENIAITDSDSDVGQLKIHILSSKHMHFENTATQKVEPIDQCTYADVQAGNIVAIHDGGVDAPSSVLRASDGDKHADAAMSVTFHRVYRAPELHIAETITLAFEMETHQVGMGVSVAIGAKLGSEISDADSTELTSLHIRIDPTNISCACILSSVIPDGIQSVWKDNALHVEGVASIADYVHILNKLSCELTVSENVVLPQELHFQLHIKVSDAHKQSQEVITQVQLKRSIPVRTEEKTAEEGVEVDIESSHTPMSDNDPEMGVDSDIHAQEKVEESPVDVGEDKKDVMIDVEVGHPEDTEKE